MKRIFFTLAMVGFLAASAAPALAKHGHHGCHHHHHHPKHHHVKYVSYERPYYQPVAYYAPPRPVVVRPVAYPVSYYAPPSLFNLNLKL